MTETSAADLASHRLEVRLGYRFHDRSLLEQALVHRSAGRRDRRGMANNERLEFLGDRVLGLAIADALMAAFPAANEGGLTRRLVALVRAETLAEIAEELDLGAALSLAPSERATGGERRQSTLADAFEAVLGAIYLDGGYAAAATVIGRAFEGRLRDVGEAPRDGKTALQEWTLKRKLGLPTYATVERSGPDHAPQFKVEVTVQGFPPASGEGGAKQAAEQAAATAFLAARKAGGVRE